MHALRLRGLETHCLLSQHGNGQYVNDIIADTDGCDPLLFRAVERFKATVLRRSNSARFNPPDEPVRNLTNSL